MAHVPKTLRLWFLAHCVVDFYLGVPLLIAPHQTAALAHIPLTGTALSARLIGAALIGIGSISFFARNEGVEAYKNLLILKIIWAKAAIVAMLLSLQEGAPLIAWLVLSIFLLFASVWAIYFRRLVIRRGT